MSGEARLLCVTAPRAPLIHLVSSCRYQPMSAQAPPPIRDLPLDLILRDRYCTSVTGLLTTRFRFDLKELNLDTTEYSVFYMDVSVFILSNFIDSIVERYTIWIMKNKISQELLWTSDFSFVFFFWIWKHLRTDGVNHARVWWSSVTPWTERLRSQDLPALHLTAAHVLSQCGLVLVVGVSKCLFKVAQEPLIGTSSFSFGNLTL